MGPDLQRRQVAMGSDLKEKLWPSDGHAKPSTCVAIEAMPSVLVPKQVEIASAEDPTLQLVHQVIVTLVVKGNLFMIKGG